MKQKIILEVLNIINEASTPRDANRQIKSKFKKYNLSLEDIKEVLNSAEEQLSNNKKLSNDLDYYGGSSIMHSLLSDYGFEPIPYSYLKLQDKFFRKNKDDKYSSSEQNGKTNLLSKLPLTKISEQDADEIISYTQGSKSSKQNSNKTFSFAQKSNSVLNDGFFEMPEQDSKSNLSTEFLLNKMLEQDAKSNISGKPSFVEVGEDAKSDISD
ncbi:MAG: hypothetical protein U1E31_00805 [Rickettsiales bacterium]